MSISVVYWSGTGNTETMAEAVAAGIKSAGREARLVSVDVADAQALLQEAAFALGCPAMGDEVLEEGEMEPFVEALEGGLSGKKVLLFGSYDWGDGQWMRDWTERVQAAGATVIGGAGIVANNEPDDEVREALEKAGVELANS